MVKDYDKEDPFEMKAMEIPGGNIVHQAQVMSEEFRDMGTTKDELMTMFSNPFYSDRLPLIFCNSDTVPDR